MAVVGFEGGLYGFFSPPNVPFFNSLPIVDVRLKADTEYYLAVLGLEGDTIAFFSRIFRLQIPCPSSAPD